MKVAVLSRRRSASLFSSLLLAPLLLLMGQGQDPLQPIGAEKEPRIRIVAESSEKRIEDIQQSADGTRLLTHDRGFAPRLWDAKRHKLLRLLGGHSDKVTLVKFSPDGKTVLTLADNEIRLWDSLKGLPQAQYHTVEGRKYTTASFSDDGKFIAAGTDKGQILTDEIATKDNEKLFFSHTGPVTSVEFSHDGKKIVSGSADHTASIGSMVGEPMISLKGHTATVQWVSFSPDGKQVLTTGVDNTARVWDAQTGKELFKLSHFIGNKGEIPTTMMAAIYVGAKKDKILVSGEKGLLSIHDASTGSLLSKMEGHTDIIREIRVTLDGTKVATYSEDETLKMWDVEAAKEIPFDPGNDLPTAADFSPDGKEFWIGYETGSMREYDLVTGTVRSEKTGAIMTLTKAEMLSDGRLRAYVDWDKAYTFSLDNLSENQGTIGTREGTIVSPAGNWFLETGYTTDMIAGLYDSRSGKYLHGAKSVLAGAFSGDGKLLALSHMDGTVSIMETETWKLLGAWQWQKDPLPSIAMSPDGKWVMTSGHDKNDTILVWDPLTGKSKFTIDEKMGYQPALAFSPDSKKAAIVSSQGILLFDVTNGKYGFGQLAFRESMIGCRAAFSPKGKYIVATTVSHICLWEVATGKLILDGDLNTRDSGDPSHLFSPDESHILWGAGPVVDVVDLPSANVSFSLKLNGQVNDAFYAENGTRILTDDATDSVSIWDAKPPVSQSKRPWAKRLGQMMILQDGSWLVVDSDGRYDAEDPSNINGAHFVLDWKEGLEPIAIPQLKQQFYDPGLMTKLLGTNKEPRRDVPALDDLKLYPTVDLSLGKTGKVEVALKERDGGGIGKVTISLNGKTVATKEGTGFFTFDSNSYSQFMLPETYLPKGQGNLLSVQVTNEKGDLSSDAVTLDLGVPSGLKTPQVHVYALCAGVGNYPGTKSDLQAPPSDAISLGKALKDVGERLLPGHISVDVLTTDATEAEARPTRTRIMEWFDETTKKATSSDIVLVFFAGHGASQIGQQKGYFFLTSEADPSAGDAISIGTSTITGEDLKKFLSGIAANKQVVILDTCHSGAAASSLISQERSLSGDYQRAWESIKDATGTWMLAGAAADQLSYESSNVEHGMLTYSLLEAIDKASPDGLRSTSGGELFVDVERWLSYAAGRVESLKQDLGLKGVQRPEFKRSRAGSTFDIGVTSVDRRGALGLRAPKPIVIVGEFELDKEDPAGVEEKVKAAMSDSAEVKAWLDVAMHPNVYGMTGTYTIEGNVVKVHVYLQAFDDAQKRKTLETFDVVGAKDAIPALAADIRKQIEARVKKYETAKKPAEKEPGGS